MNSKLISYGFMFDGEVYKYTCPVMNGGFRLLVIASDDSVLSYTVIDCDTDEEYVLFRLTDYVGAFVGKLRNECDRILSDIEEKCFDRVSFKQSQTAETVEYIKQRYGDSPEFPWKDENAVFRNKMTGKWYCALLTVKKRSLGMESDGTLEVLNLKAYPERVSELVNFGCLPAYHMNKKHWYTLPLDGRYPSIDVFKLIDESYECVDKK